MIPIYGPGWSQLSHDGGLEMPSPCDQAALSSIAKAIQKIIDIVQSTQKASTLRSICLQCIFSIIHRESPSSFVRT
jgi:hypothetical protein